MVNDSKQSLNAEYYEHFIATVSSEIIVQEIPKRVLPSVTNILNVTMSEKSKTALENWKKNMIKKLGEDGFNKYSKGKIHHIFIKKKKTSLLFVTHLCNAALGISKKIIIFLYN